MANVYAANAMCNKLQAEVKLQKEAIHRALSFLQQIVDDEPFTTGEADRVMGVLRKAVCKTCRNGDAHTSSVPHL